MSRASRVASRSGEAKRLLECAQAHGWSVETTRDNHLRFVRPSDGYVVITGSNLAGRDYYNARAELRRAGLPVDQRPKQLEVVPPPEGVQEKEAEMATFNVMIDPVAPERTPKRWTQEDDEEAELAERTERRRWSVEEDDLLLDGWRSKSVNAPELAEMLGRTVAAVQARAYLLGPLHGVGTDIGAYYGNASRRLNRRPKLRAVPTSDDVTQALILQLLEAASDGLDQVRDQVRELREALDVERQARLAQAEELRVVTDAVRALDARVDGVSSAAEAFTSLRNRLAGRS